MLEQALTGTQQQEVTAVALDMWRAYANAVSENLSQALIVHDRFHISQNLNEAVGKVRRHENKRLNNEGDEQPNGSKDLWLTNEENMGEEARESFERLKHVDLKVARARAIKESFKASKSSGATPAPDAPNAISTNGTAGQSAAAWSRSRRKHG